MKYKLLKGRTIQREDGAMIPADPSNLDYQAYLVWLSEGNTPQPADPEVPMAVRGRDKARDLDKLSRAVATGDQAEVNLLVLNLLKETV